MSTSTADTIRAELKAAGYNARAVTVRANHSTLRVTVRQPVDIRAIKQIVKRHECVRYCEATHEILSGGNTFVDVRYDDAVIAPVALQIAQRVLDAGPGVLVQIGDRTVGYLDQHWFETRREHGDSVNAWVGYGPATIAMLSHGAQILAADLISRGVAL